MNENTETMTFARKFTIKEFLALLGLDEKADYLLVASFVNFLVRYGIAKKLDEKRAQPSGRGKPSDVYEIPHEAVIQFWDENKAEQVIDVEAEVVTTNNDANNEVTIPVVPITPVVPIVADTAPAIVSAPIASSVETPV